MLAVVLSTHGMDTEIDILAEPALFHYPNITGIQWRSQDFSKGEGSHWNIVRCLLKKRLTKGGGSRTPQDPPSYAHENIELVLCPQF